jgi:hypothetical protein
MSGIGEYFISEEQQQQQSTHSSGNTDALSITIDTQSEMNLTNITKDNLDDPTLIYKISFGFICAFLCLLTITGNLLVLLTFRRIRRVSMPFKINE